MSTHETYMYRCLQLARLGEGKTRPNPLVGCVITCNGLITGEGYHHGFGLPHAEVEAVCSVKDKGLLSDSTLFVNLEPCTHHGKTPPCTDLILKHNIRKVVIGSLDPYEEVNGKAIALLRSNHVEVITGVLEKECREVNKRFMTFHEKKRPYILLKWARSRDGFIGKTDKPVKISNELANLMVHQWRSQEAAILIGTNTALVDNPKLTTRNWPGKNPVRVILDRTLRLPEGLHVFNVDAPSLVFNAVKNHTHGNLIYIKIDFTNNVLQQVLSHLYTRNINSLLVEGGAEILQSFLDEDLWDEAIEIEGILSLRSGVRAPMIKNRPWHAGSLGDNNLFIYSNTGKGVL